MVIDTHLQNLVYGSFSDPVDPKASITKITIKPVSIQSKIQLQVTHFDGKKTVTKNLPCTSKELEPYMKAFKTIFLRCTDAEYHYSQKKDGTFSHRKTALQTQIDPDLSHNRQKNYILQEGTPYDFLIELGIQSKDGKIIKSAYSKFTQINRFLELVSDVLSHIKEKKIRVVDFGSGKAYLTFALYYFLSKQYDVHITGVERNTELIEKSNALSKKLSFSNLHFECCEIEQFQTDRSIDMVVALHACDTATDKALLQAITHKAKIILCAPCCQHELASQIKKDAFPLLLEHSFLKEQFSSLLTDALRIRFLTLHGYKVQAIEFVDPVHTPKNLLIRAVLTNKKASQKEQDEYTKTIELFSLRLYLQFQQLKKST